MATCKYPECGGEFVAKTPTAEYCCPSHQAKHLRPWEKAAAVRVERDRERRQRKIATLATSDPEKIERQGYSRGYQSARHKYHYRTFIKQLRDALVASVSASGGPPSGR